MKPNFLVIGAPKSATTSLCDKLKQHPEVFFSAPKETFFFCYDHVYEKKGWPWFESLFEGAEGFKAIGEGSTINANLGTYPNALPRIVEHVPDAKIIYIVREPIRRIESYWVELHSQGTITVPFNRAVREDPQLLDTSLYWKQISAYREHFSDDRILTLFFEDFKRDAAGELRRCFAFLEIDPEVHIEDAQTPKHVTQGRNRDLWLTNMMRHRLPGFYAIRDAVPKPIRDGAKRLLKRPIDTGFEWEPGVLAWTLDQLREDSAAFLDYAGKPADFWDMSPYEQRLRQAG
ncbi:MAG: sulfotransferase family protein [Phycisphaeraceae bacterium]